MHEQLVELCFKGRRELGAYVRAAISHSAIPSSTARSSARSAFRGQASCRSCPIFSHLAGRFPTGRVAVAFDDEWTNLLFVGRVIPNKRIEDLVRIFHAYRTAINPRSRLLLVGAYGGFEKYLAMVQSVAARLGTPDVHFPGM